MTDSIKNTWADRLNRAPKTVSLLDAVANVVLNTLNTAAHIITY